MLFYFFILVIMHITKFSKYYKYSFKTISNDLNLYIEKLLIYFMITYLCITWKTITPSKKD